MAPFRSEALPFGQRRKSKLAPLAAAAMFGLAGVMFMIPTGTAPQVDAMAQANVPPVVAPADPA